jgi:hypothetical protein
VTLGWCRFFLDAPQKYRAVEVLRIPRKFIRSESLVEFHQEYILYNGALLDWRTS